MLALSLERSFFLSFRSYCTSHLITYLSYWIDHVHYSTKQVCALYGSEGWHALLVQVLPRLSECQKKLSDWAGYLSSCIKLLSLDPGPISDDDRSSIQAEIVKLAHGGLPVPVSLDVSTLITFAARGGPPLELCEGDPGTLMVIVWSGFPDDITMDSLSLTLVTTFTADEGTRVSTILNSD